MTFAETTAHANQQTSIYDCAGQRVRTTVNSITRTMVYDIFGQGVADYSGSSGGTLERENIYRSGQLLATYEAGSSALKYVLTDAQGSTRALMNNSGGSSTVIARHDYLPFGEEISSGIGLRTGSQGYGATDTNRQKYGLTERDDTTGLDHTWWRKYENLSGRWSSPDPYNGSMAIGDPQSFNRFAYTQNDPVNSVDPSGLLMIIIVQNPWGSDPFADFYASIGWPYEDGGGWDPGLDPGGGGGVPQNPAPTPPKPPNRTTPSGLTTDACDNYAKAGRPDLARVCRKFRNEDFRNRMRQCLLNHFYAPKRGRGGYLGPLGSNPTTLFGVLEILLGPETHANCLEQTFRN